MVGSALVTQRKQITNRFGTSILERRMQGMWHLEGSHTSSRLFMRENLFQTSSSLLNRVHVEGESATPHQTTETFPVGPLTLSPEPQDIIEAKRGRWGGALSHVQISRFLAPHPRTKNSTAVWATARCARSSMDVVKLH